MNLYVGGIKIPKHDKGSGVLWSGGNAGAYALIRPMIIDRANAKAIGGLLTGERNHIYFSIEPTMTMVYESISSAGSGGLHTPTMSPQEPLPTPPTPPTPPIPPIPPTPPTTTARRAVSFADEKDEDDEDDDEPPGGAESKEDSRSFDSRGTQTISGPTTKRMDPRMRCPRTGLLFAQEVVITHDLKEYYRECTSMQKAHREYENGLHMHDGQVQMAVQLLREAIAPSARTSMDAHTN
mmetsp:Transcript_15649/g.26123  ORF Transcript_15649/g.26123 Transcript_15649/m.26123 type:complete len:238 (-) Transcript_15649:173-886(-)|eukprot:CAMPEP_0174973116 /NCGR_PEP_ID=MMETSP0004_2-20121128/11039_1 /TAXON_ID=420556 /ORGANISM="Ochromonas sp., Strain CCMP1393" /LENGTH=237 /DNA_ID=CAMNT_0016223481 /DNA_START=573 /DNA_END=1286 /DNA_ORIENTATION=-